MNMKKYRVEVTYVVYVEAKDKKGAISKFATEMTRIDGRRQIKEQKIEELLF